ncbi:phosphoenolpyruvate synthase (plasmid) [Pedobacter sp. BS3]|uniref:phosphoenolpyruvate synthase n=1 Tax=Pedobacter sp. BS3 TaxID=2567937 RepID=UPI0011EF58C6|nr:phosphoenolpyruvate synthase [Pedobacter sp. BS3]TZF86419.1 phosphoenolpyruvate synthase [Pedobacter sp. BS3]
MNIQATPFILNLSEVGIHDIDIAGGKNASLGEMLQHLSNLGIRIPGGFVITVGAYKSYIQFNNLENRIKAAINSIIPDSVDSLKKTGAQVRALITEGTFPPELTVQITAAYNSLCKHYKQQDVDVAVRSSATAEDLPDASFAGQQETFLNVNGVEAVLSTVKQCFASLFTDRAISYRQSFGYDHFQIGLSVCVQKMVRSDLGASGVAFSLDTESGFKDVVIINGSYGLGEMVVQGAVSPDEFIVFKPALKQGYKAIIEKKLGVKDKKMVYSDVPGERVKIVPVTPEHFNQFCIPDAMILQLANWVSIIENYYSTLKQRWCPMDVEWAVDGKTGELFIVQARPETIHSQKKAQRIIEYQIDEPADSEKIILTGIAVGSKIASGRVNILLDRTGDQDIHFTKGDVLVTDMTDPDWEPVMKQASAIITNKGGRTCHAAIVARELGIPAIVGCGNATELLSNGQLVTASCAQGNTGIIYDGKINFTPQEFDLNNLPAIKTPVMLNVASPDHAFRFSGFPASGIGLAREEFIINNYIKIHPLALIHHKQLGDAALSEQIADLCRGFDSEREFFIEKLSYGIARIAASAYPNKVIVRFSDFKSNEYYNLLGGEHFEPQEENPMIGWRGASRYYSPEYKEAFGLECTAIRKVRNEMGLSNVVVMIPFCRTVKELQLVYQTMNEFGLKRGENGLEVYLMAELPSNVLMADEFAQYIDGFSIGSNDLTQLVLGLDRDSSLVSHIYDERDRAVKTMIDMLIRSAKKAGIKVGICGQGPSDFPDFAQFLVAAGIDSISVTPDSFFKTVNAIAEAEKFDIAEPA